MLKTVQQKNELAKLMLDYCTAGDPVGSHCNFNPTILQKNIKNIPVQ